MTPTVITPQIEPRLDWLDLTDALAAGHALPKAEIGDTFLYRGPDTVLSRAAWIDGMGIAVKTAVIVPAEPQMGGAVSLFNDATGALEAYVDFHLLTKWKTAADSLLAARRLARPDSRNILIVGAGTIAGAMIEAYRAGFPDAQVTIWNRTAGAAQTLADHTGAHMAHDLENAVQHADIICCATMATKPVIQGDWLRPGQHLDLIGAYRSDMREVDDSALRRSRIFVDSFDTTLDHIGELKIPLDTGAIERGDVIADYYQLDRFHRVPTDITLFKNGGGAHLDLMTARYILKVWQMG